MSIAVDARRVRKTWLNVIRHGVFLSPPLWLGLGTAPQALLILSSCTPLFRSLLASLFVSVGIRPARKLSAAIDTARPGITTHWSTPFDFARLANQAVELSRHLLTKEQQAGPDDSMALQETEEMNCGLVEDFFADLGEAVSVAEAVIEECSGFQCRRLVCDVVFERRAWIAVKMAWPIHIFFRGRVVDQTFTLVGNPSPICF